MASQIRNHEILQEKGNRFFVCNLGTIGENFQMRHVWKCLSQGSALL